MSQNIPAVRLTLTRAIDSTVFPAWVEAELMGVDGQVWRFQDKLPVFTEQSEVTYPLEVWFPCTVLDEQITGSGELRYLISTQQPFGLRDVAGQAVQCWVETALLRRGVPLLPFSPPVGYPAIYTDGYGQEFTTIFNDGQELSLTLRDVTFRGHMLDDFAPVAGTTAEALSSFTLAEGALAACELAAAWPLSLVVGGQTVTATMNMSLTLGPPRGAPRFGLESEQLQLVLEHDGRTWRSSGENGFFDDELQQLEQQLLPETHLKCCHGCALSDYSPAGMGLFGSLVCFRNTKLAYRRVQNKYDLFQLWPHHTEQVQETFVCSEFEPRRPGTGYRG